MQRTLERSFELSGIGIHGGRFARLRMTPAPPDFGIRFGRPKSMAVLARVDSVTGARLGTSLGAGASRVATVEHVLAALAGLGIDNAMVTLLEGDECPILDGSAAPYVNAMSAAGFVAQSAPRWIAVVERPVTVEGRGGAFVRLEPAESAMLAGTYQFRPPIGRQSVAFDSMQAAFRDAIAPARTFGFEEDIASMHRSGRARGGSLDNAVVFGPMGPLNPEGLRFPDECARHKLLDAVGDLALFGRPWRGRYVAQRGGHALNVALVMRALATPGVIRIVRG